MDDLELAHCLADKADSLSLPAFRAHDFTVSQKPDMTPVTDVDRAVEHALREIIVESRPDDSLYGEEFGAVGEGARRWIIDPIDGTKNFVRGVPVYATLIGLYEGATPLLGVVSAPALGRRWWGTPDGGAFARFDGEDRRISVSEVSELADASLAFSSLSGWRDLGKRDKFVALTDDVWRLRGYGDFWSYMLVAEGAVDIAAEPELELYDMAALVPIVQAAGGVFTDVDGRPGPFGPNAVASNGRLHQAALEKLA